MIDYKALKSGTDIRGVAIGEGNVFTKESVYDIAGGIWNFLCKKQNISNVRVAVGYDSRVSSPEIAKNMVEALTSFGAMVYDCGMCSTPAMFMSIVNFHFDAAIEITASHLPMEMNGIKIFTREGGLSGKDIEQILKDAEMNISEAPEAVFKSTSFDIMSSYCEGLCNMIKEGVASENYNKPLEGMKIAVDAGNGVGGFYAHRVLQPLGADVSGSQFLEPDGNFPNHIPNPENKVAMKSISDAVMASGADLGIIFDTDCDRAACVDEKGTEINRNKLVALASYIALKDSPAGTIVTDSVTSDGLALFIEKNLGGKHHRFKRGYKNVIDEAKRLQEEGENAPLAIETSGHAAFRENYYLDDGAYLVTKIIIEAALLNKQDKAIDSLISELKLPCEEREVRFKIKLTDFKGYGQGVIKDLEELCRKREGASVCPVNYEGVRINFDKNHGDGWLLLRMSVHEPILVLNTESDTIGGTDTMLGFFKSFIVEYDSVDSSVL